MNQNLKGVLATEPVDLRKSFNGPYVIARNELGEVPENGTIFIFSNRTRTRIKVLRFDGTGCWMSGSVWQVCDQVALSGRFLMTYV